MTKDNLLIIHVTDWGTPDGIAPYLVSLDLRARSSMGRLLRREEPFLLFARDFLEAFVAAAMSSGHDVWVNVARRVENCGNWPRWANRIEQIPALFHAVAAESADIFPVSVWLIPTGLPDAVSRLEDFRTRPFDDKLFSAILDLGIIRVSLDDEFCDIATSVKLRPELLRWMQIASEGQRLQVHWLLIPE